MYQRQYKTDYHGSRRKRPAFIDAEFWEGMRGGFLRRPKYNVPLNIAETDDAYEVHVYAVGFNKSHITLTVEDDVLWIKGKRPVDSANAPKFKRQEFPIKHFERVVSLHGQVDTGKISAQQDGEILKITLPKIPEARSSSHTVDID